MKNMISGMKMDKDKLAVTLSEIYDFTVGQSTPDMLSARELAEKYGALPGSIEQRIDRLIRRQSGWAACSGFISGFGGLFTVVVTAPLNIASVMFLQMRMVAAIAMICGCDPQDRRVKSFAIACMLGEGAVDLIKNVTLATARLSAEKIIVASNKLLLRRIQEKALRKIMERAVKTAMPRVLRVIPLAGGVAGGAVDALAVAACGAAAKKVFLDVYIRRYLETQLVEDTDYGTVTMRN